MKIKEVSIMRYGPLPNTGRISFHDFNLFFGKNEDGKTLTIDALVKLLMGRNIRDFERIDRVEEKPEGYVIVEDDKGKEVKLPERGDLTKVVDLTQSECRNIFVIRNSNLSIAHESDFFTSVTDRLTGLRTEELSRIRNNLREIGRITPSGAFKDIKHEKLKTRLQKAETLIERISALLKKMTDGGCDELEEEHVRCREQIDRVEQELESLEDARRREKYEKATEALTKLEDQEESSEAEELRTREQRVQSLHDRKDKIDQNIKPQIHSYQTDKEKLAGQEAKNQFFTLVTAISAGLLLLSLLGSIIASHLLFYALVLLFLLSTGIALAFKYQFVRSKSQLAEAFERIKRDGSEFDLAADSIEGIRASIRAFEEECSTEEDNLRDLNDRMTELMARQRGILASLLGEKGETLNETISYWKEEIRRLEKYSNSAKGVTYDEDTVSELKGKKQLREQEMQDIESRMQSFRDEMKDVEQGANEILRLEQDRLYCDTSVDLKALKDTLREFIDKNESRKDNVLGVIRIFEEIESEEKQKVSELFGKDSPVSKYFHEITRGLYEEVLFNQGTGEIEVRRRDGVILEAEKLSGGAYDQLYLSVRLALGEELLKGKKGFFIMDDPFVKADPDRLQRQLETLKRISQSGWQVMYFSAKGEVKDALEKDIESGTVNYVEVQSIFP